MKLQVDPARASGNLQANWTLLLALLFSPWALFSKVRKYINIYPKISG